LIALILVIMSSSVSVFITTQITMIAEKNKLFEVVSPALLSSLRLIPYGLVWILFSFMYIFIPNTKVRFFSGVLAGLIAGTIYQFVQGGYIYFQVKISNYNAIYGSFAALPFFVIWLQISWLVMLLGAEIAFYHQNIEAYQHDHQFSSLSLSLKQLLALRIVHFLIINFSQGNPPLTDHHIADTLKLPLPLVQKHLTELIASGIISNTPVNDDNDFAYQPAKAIDLLTVQFVLNALEHQGRNTAQFIQENEFSVFADILQQFDRTVAQSPANRLLKDISLEGH
jgi:membrane protein